MSEILSAWESVLLVLTRHHVSRLSTACLGGNGGLGVWRRDFFLWEQNRAGAAAVQSLCGCQAGLLGMSPVS